MKQTGLGAGARAWLVDCGGGMLAAISVDNMLHVIEDFALVHRVPLTPDHCNQVLIWQTHLLPVVDLAIKAKRTELATFEGADKYLCALGWRNANGESNYGALLVRALPRQIAITDASMKTPSPIDGSIWRESALGFFAYHNRTVPIVNVAALFAVDGSADLVSLNQRQHS